MSKTPKRPRDLNQWAKRMVDIATGEASDRELTPEEQGKDPAAVKRGRSGGKKGGKARAAALSESERRASAAKAARVRWSRK
jgi:phage gp16-like protein